MEVLVDRDGGVVIKRAESDDDRRRLAHEGAILRAVAHPGVARLVGPPAALTATNRELAELTVELAPGGDLREVIELPPARAIDLGAALATIVADLHHLGVAHGRLEECHVLLDADGRPVICGFGGARWLPSGGDGTESRRADVQAVAALVSRRVGRAAPRRLARCLHRAAATGFRGDARWLARSLIAAAPDLGHARHRTRRPVIIAASAVGLVVGGVMAWQSTIRPGAAMAADASCPAVDLGCGPLSAAGGVLTVGGARYGVGSGDVIVAGRWQCGRSGLPAMLQVATGDVWVFDRWPGPGRLAATHLVGRYPSATSLEVRPARSGCDALVVDRSRQPPVLVRPDR